MGKVRTDVKCQKYLNNKTRIKNKERQLAKKLSKLKPEKVEIVKRDCRIGREKEGFGKESFKFKPRKKKEIVQNENESK